MHRIFGKLTIFKDSTLITLFEEENVLNVFRETTSITATNITFSGLENIEDTLLEKFAVSDAMALSVKLDVWESLIEDLVESISDIPINMKRGKWFLISRSSLKKKTGQLLYLRSRINLASHLLIPPDFYWDRPKLESIYNIVCNEHLDLQNRTKVANNRLTHTSELLDLLRDYKHQYSTERLEIIIIVLIFVEIVIEVSRHT